VSTVRFVRGVRGKKKKKRTVYWDVGKATVKRAIKKKKQSGVVSDPWGSKKNVGKLFGARVKRGAEVPECGPQGEKLGGGRKVLPEFI